MFVLRDFVWDYPAGVIRFIRKYQLFFLTLAMFIVGALVTMVSVGFAKARIHASIYDETLKIGVLGNYSVVNPLDVGASEPEKLLSRLLFNSLVTIDSSGRIYPELAETWEISPDGKTYTFFLKKNIKWHDGVEFTSQDVLTTFSLLRSGDTDTVQGNIAKDLEVKPAGVYQVSFTLPQVNAAFLELMETPILPDHIYRDFSLARIQEQGDTITPVGTGPYEFKQQKNNTIYLARNKNYFQGVPHIANVTISYFEQYQAARNAFYSGEIHLLYPIDSQYLNDYRTSAAFSNIVKLNTIERTNNQRVLIINTKPTAENQHGVPVDVVEFRQALAQSINRNEILPYVPGATAAYGPFDSTSLAYSSSVETLLPFDKNAVATKLDKLGWTFPYSGAPYRMKGDNQLTLAITFLDAGVNRQIASQIRSQFSDVGINASLVGVSSDTLQQQVLPNKDFELLLFELQTGVDPDQYGLWHSTQTTFPGLNLGSLDSRAIDSLLEKGRLQTNRDKRLEIYKDFQEELVKEAPAIFLYRPAYSEVFFDIIDRKVTNSAVEPSDRFKNINEWKLIAR